MKILNVMWFPVLTNENGRAEVEIQGLGKLNVNGCLSAETIAMMQSDVTAHVNKLLEAAK